MPALTKKQLLARVVAALQGAGARVLVFSTQHPFRLSIQSDTFSAVARVYIWNVTHGGGSRDPNEFRIQITTSPQATEDQILLLGWYEPLSVFAAFDPAKHGSPGESASVQIRIETLRRAAESGLGSQSRGRSEIALAVRPDYLLGYVEDQTGLHALAGDDTATEFLSQIASGEADETDIPVSVGKKRKAILRTIAMRERDRSFRARVLAAYDHKCAACDVQLRLVKAAHVVPVAHSSSTDETTNGIALCSLHHDAYDAGVLEIRADTSMRLNGSALRRLKALGLVSGLSDFRDGLRRKLRPPIATTDRPNAAYLRLGMQLRDPERLQSS